MLLQNCSAVFRSNQHTTFGDEVNGWFNRRAAIEVNRSITVDKTQTNGFFLSGLPGLPVFDTVGEPATLAQRMESWIRTVCH